MKLVLLRHGATAWSVSGQHTGLSDIALLPEGVDQAKRAAENVRSVLGEEWESAVVISSPLQRAQITAEIVFTRERVSTTNTLLEMDYGDYDGLTSSEIRSTRPNWNLWRDGCPNGETVDEVGARCDEFLRSISRPEQPSNTFVAVAHGHVLRILAARTLELPAVQGRLFTLGTAATSVIEDVRGQRCVSLWNLSA